MKHHKKLFFVLLLMSGIVLILSKCIQPSKVNDPRGKAYAGAATCRTCHQALYDTFLNTAHFKATSEAIPDNILGHFESGKNIFNYDSWY
jgi:hypothetical protein